MNGLALCAGAGGPGRTGGMVNTATIADRVEAIADAFLRVARVEVKHGDAFDSLDVLEKVFDGSEFYDEAEPSTFVYLDPPYVGATGYGWECSRDAVLELATLWVDAGATVAVSEAEPLPIDGWHHVDLTRPGGKPEWLTVSRAPARLPERERQRQLFSEGVTRG